MLQRLHDKKLTYAERDNYFGRMAMDKDLSGDSDFVESNPDIFDRYNVALYGAMHQDNTIDSSVEHSLRD
jgi:hypothetical protein